MTVVDPLSPISSRLFSHECLEAAVCEAVFSYQLQQPLVDLPQPPHYYLALQGRDPAAALLARGFHPPTSRFRSGTTFFLTFHLVYETYISYMRRSCYTGPLDRHRARTDQRAA